MNFGDYFSVNPPW